MEERIARLEVKVDHIQSDIGEVKLDVRKLNEKLDAVKDAVNATQLGRAFDRVWWLLMSGALLGIMARAFKWV